MGSGKVGSDISITMDEELDRQEMPGPRQQNIETSMTTIATKDDTRIHYKEMYSAKRRIFFLCGVMSLTLGIIGMFLPLLPTTPFLILSAVCFEKSSEKAHQWLLTNKWCGEYIQNYREKNGISLRHKILSLSLLWATIGYSVFFAAGRLWLQLLLIAVASGVTAHIISIATCKGKAKALFRKTA